MSLILHHNNAKTSLRLLQCLPQECPTTISHLPISFSSITSHHMQSHQLLLVRQSTLSVVLPLLLHKVWSSLYHPQVSQNIFTLTLRDWLYIYLYIFKKKIIKKKASQGSPCLKIGICCIADKHKLGDEQKGKLIISNIFYFPLVCFQHYHIFDI